MTLNGVTVDRLDDRKRLLSSFDKLRRDVDATARSTASTRPRRSPSTCSRRASSSRRSTSPRKTRGFAPSTVTVSPTSTSTTRPDRQRPAPRRPPAGRGRGAGGDAQLRPLGQPRKHELNEVKDEARTRPYVLLTPDVMSDEEAALLRRLYEIRPLAPARRERGFWAKVKESLGA